MISRNWPIRSKIIALVAVPFAALLALWIFATTLAVGPALNLLAARTLLDEVGRPAEALVAQLQQERRLSLVYLAGETSVAALRDRRVRTDQAIADFRRRASGDTTRDRGGHLLGVRLDQLTTALDILPSGRGFIDRREMDKSGALGLYNGVIESAFRVFAALSALPDESLNRQARAITALGRAREALGQADALLAGVFAAGRFAEGEHGQLVQIIGTQRFLYAEAVAELSAADRVAYQRLTEGEEFTRLRAMEASLIDKGRAGAAVPIDQSRWRGSYEAVQNRLRDFELAATDALAERTRPVAVSVLLRLGLAGVLGLAALVTSVVIALRVGRSLIRRLTGLRAAALEMADNRLPDLVRRLRRGDEVDVAREAPPLEYGDDEIGQVGKAFNEVQRTAVRSAVDEAALRRGLREVYINIARRSQALLHRQLALLDRMERRVTDPAELEDLFRVDHLATRMRRHAEDLVILAGAAPGRGWRTPVPMLDVIRGAVSEVADYARVDVDTVQPAATVGRAVGDVIHLLAELIENATSFSPPHTHVSVGGQMVAKGYAIEIEDRGLGMAPEAIEEANQRLADPPEFDPANNVRLGLFVVAQLSARHGIQVRLRRSPYGGVTAVVLLPRDLVTTDSVAARRPRDARAGAPAGAEVPPTGDSARPDRPARPRPPAAPPARNGHRDGPAPAPRRPAPIGADSASPGTGAAGDDPASAMRARTAELPVGPARAAAVPVGADGLPRRIRQASLAPQLREPAPQPDGRPGDGDAAKPRSPEQVRAAMSALQTGTARGRQAAAAVPEVDSRAGGADPASGFGRPEARTEAADRPATATPSLAPSDSSPATARGSTASDDESERDT